MLPPEYLATLPDELVVLMEQLEDELLEDICSRIAENDTITGTAENDIRILQSQGLDLAEIQKKISEMSGLSLKEIDGIFDNAMQEAQKYNDKLFNLAQNFPPQNAMQTLNAEVNAIRAQIKSDVFNMTQSLGFAFMQGGRTYYLPIAEAYQQALNKAAYAVRSGAVSYNQAIKEAVDTLANSGVRVVSYESGHKDNVDVAVRRAVMTGVNQVGAKYSDFSGDYLETDLVETSAHIGARDKQGANGWEAHTAWQGRVFRRSDKVKTSQGEYPDFVLSTGYGDVQGLCGANCRHSFTPFIEGVSERTYTDEQLKNIDPPPFEYQGKEYTAYEATQMQRKLERTMRNVKRKMIAYKGSGLKEEYQTAQIKLRRLLQQYREFSNIAGLRMQMERTELLYK